MAKPQFRDAPSLGPTLVQPDLPDIGTTMVELYDDSLGRLELGCDPFVVSSLQIGSPAVREVVRARSLMSGVIDDTQYLGARAITLTVRLKNFRSSCSAAQWSDMQGLMDQVARYMNPKLRPVFLYQLPHSDKVRMMVVRGVAWPISVNNPKFPVMTYQFVCPGGEIFDGSNGGAMSCIDIVPTGDEEFGRHYGPAAAPPDGPPGGSAEDQFGPYYTNSTGEVERQYPHDTSQLIGGRQINNPGSASAHWELTIFGPTTNPSFQVNEHTMIFDRNGGVDLAENETLVVNTRDRTILINGEEGASRYDRSNYLDWTWDELKLVPGTNVVRFTATVLTEQSTARLCTRPVYL